MLSTAISPIATARRRPWSGPTARANTTFSTTSLAYDGLDRLATTTCPDSSTETFSHDADGNVLTRLTRASQTIMLT
jgi:YD repeat-containing protein